jgi:hypothetical protein
MKKTITTLCAVAFGGFALSLLCPSLDWWSIPVGFLPGLLASIFKHRQKGAIWALTLISAFVPLYIAFLTKDSLPLPTEIGLVIMLLAWIPWIIALTWTFIRTTHSRVT